jgi:hypothetical protein
MATSASTDWSGCIAVHDPNKALRTLRLARLWNRLLKRRKMYVHDQSNTHTHTYHTHIRQCNLQSACSDGNGNVGGLFSSRHLDCSRTRAHRQHKTHGASSWKTLFSPSNAKNRTASRRCTTTPSSARPSLTRYRPLVHAASRIGGKYQRTGLVCS